MDEAQLNPADYIVTPNIPILDEGELVVPREGDENETIKVTPALLREIRDNMNRKHENTGDLCVLAVGHVKRDNGVDETSQAPVIGYARHWTVRTRDSDGKRLLCYDEWLRKDARDVPRKYPRRSPDLWLGRKEIDPIAYLGATTPHRDLGLHPLSLSRQGDDQVLRVPYMPVDEKPKEDETKGDAKLLDAINGIAKMLGDLTAQVSALSAGGPAGAGGPGAGGAGEPEMSPEEAEAELQKLLGGQGAPSGGPEPEPEPKEKPKQMAREDVIDTEKDTLKKQVAEMALQLARTDVTTKLKALEADGVLIPDMDAEVTDILAMPAEMRVTQLARIEKNYKKAPGGKVNPALEAAAEKAKSGDVQKVMSLARDEKLTFDDAHVKLYGCLPGVKK